MSKPFQFPDSYGLDIKNKLSDRSLRDYVAMFVERRDERPNGKFVSEDIQELMRLAEDLEAVDASETTYLLELARKHPDYFADGAQRLQMELFARTHDVLRKVSKDEFTKDFIAAVPVTLFRTPQGREFLSKAQALSDVLKSNNAYHAANGMFNPEIVHEVNKLALEMRRLAGGLTLSDIDKRGSEARTAYLRDLANMLVRTTGHTDHESEWKDGKWTNWNRDVEVYPVNYEEPGTHDDLRSLLQRPGPVRMVAGGHAFNISSSMGGTKDEPAGALITLDKHELSPGVRWRRVKPEEAVARYQISNEQAARVVRASAGIRLRDFAKEMWAEGMALPVAGSTDAQSLGGLIATDLHSTGKSVGFLSSQLLEVVVFSANGEPVRFIKDESVPRGRAGRWTWTPPGNATSQLLDRLPVAGALGVLGVVAEIVLKLDAAYNMQKIERFVPRLWAEQSLERFLNQADSAPPREFAFDHVSFYYAGGGSEFPKTVRMNAWRRTRDPLTTDAPVFKTTREIFDLVGSGFLPDYLLRLSQRQATVPGQLAAPADDDWITALNNRKSLVLPANEAFARKLFFQHDEIEVGIPLPLNSNGKVDYDVARNAIQDTLQLLKDEEFKTIIEIRFTPDVSEAMLGPGAGSPTCYIELATALGEYSTARIVALYDLFDRLMRDKYRARPHLGKKTSVAYSDMESIYGPTWKDFLAVRDAMDPDGKFLPTDNPLLTRIFRDPNAPITVAPVVPAAIEEPIAVAAIEEPVAVVAIEAFVPEVIEAVAPVVLEAPVTPVVTVAPVTPEVVEAPVVTVVTVAPVAPGHPIDKRVAAPAKMILPPSTLQNINPPDKKYQYFQFLDAMPWNLSASQFDVGTAWRLSELSLLAYGDAAFIQSAARPIEQAGFQIELREHKTTQYVVFHSDEAIVVAFRGTEIDNFWGSVCDWITDFKFRLEADDHGSRIHHGFRKAFENAWSSVVEEVQRLQQDHSQAQIFLTGHSLGAALATLTAYRATLEGAFPVAALYTFGSPLVGDSHFAAWFKTSGLAQRTYRIRNHNDVVTRVPPFPEYEHVGSLKFVDNSGHLHELPAESPDGGLNNIVTVLAESLSFARQVTPGFTVSPAVPGFIADHAPTYYTMHLFNNIE